MSEYIVYESEGIEVADYSGAKHHVSRFDKREEIVRCRECAYYERENDDEGMCMFPDDNGDYARWMVDEDGFCYLGIRSVSK